MENLLFVWQLLRPCDVGVGSVGLITAASSQRIDTECLMIILRVGYKFYLFSFRF